MKTHHFTIIASGLNPNDDDFEDHFFEAGCDDATISFQKGLLIIEFSRTAKSFAGAIVTAFENVQAAGAKVERFEPDHLVSLSEIAQRAGLSRAAVSLYGKGERGSGFPAPVARVTSESPLWDWSDVARWMHQNGKLSEEEVLKARMVREANIITQSHDFRPDLFAKRFEASVKGHDAG